MVQWTAVLLPQGKAQSVDKPARIRYRFCAHHAKQQPPKGTHKKNQKKQENAEKQRQKTTQKTAQKAYE